MTDLRIAAANYLLTLTAVCGLSASEAASGSWESVQQIFSTRCIECHGPAKQKAGVRLDTPEWISKGGKHGPVLVAGKPDASPIYLLAMKPADDEERMPPKGDPLTIEQLTSLRIWITAGAPFATTTTPTETIPTTMDNPTMNGGAMMGDATAPVTAPTAAVTTPAVTALAVTALAVTALAVTQQAAPSMPTAPSIDHATIETLAKSHILVQILPGGWLDVNAAHASNGISEDHLKLLLKLAPAVVDLDLAGTGITDKQLRLVAGFPRLERLHLERNPLTDAGTAALNGLSSLTYLNLMETSVSDGGLAPIASMTQLDELYLWNSKVTPAGVAALSAKLPQTRIVLGPGDLPSEKLEKGKGKKKK